MIEKDFNLLLEIFSNIKGIKILNSDLYNWIHFSCESQELLTYISQQTEEYEYKFLNLPEETYQVLFENQQISMFLKKIKNYYESGNSQNAKLNELGIPDLSMVTIRQMTIELKQRKNLCFALLWIEENEHDNISIEGNGDKTKLCGLLARGTNLAIQWADQNIKFKKPIDE